ncbi:MAG: AMIN domain-containing protein, partial [Cyanobacteria bacterium P01_H01_bin.58]
MKRLLGYGSCLASGALIALAAQPVYATATIITGVQVIPTDNGAQIVLSTEAGEVPQVFAVNQGNTLRADIVRTELQLASGAEFVQENPAPGIASVSLVTLDANSVRLVVDGSDRIPLGTIGETAQGGIVIDVETQTGAPPQASTPVPIELATVPGPQVAQAEEPAADEAPTGPVETDAEPDVLVPNPQVVIEGVPIPAPEVQQAPPFLPQAVPPPVGDIAVSEVNPNFGEIDLGTAERVPRLVLRNAPAREVLTLLARSADLNVVFISTGGTEEGAADVGTDGPPVTLDIENESVQEVFNSVLRITGLQANRVGRSIYVAPRLPNSAQNLIVRSLRLNQIDAPQAANFLVGLGAERAVSREREVQSVIPPEEIDEAIGEPTVETVTEEVLDVDRVDFADSTPIFRGLQVVAEERTNSVTLVGQPYLVELATAQLVRLDLRKRQVAVNVRVIDIDLDALDAFGTSFSFASGDFGTVQDGGIGVINFGNTAPGGTTLGIPAVPPIGTAPLVGGLVNTLAEDFLFQIFATVQEGNGKVLTDPTLIIQEGQEASVSLTEEVVTDVDVDIETLDTGGVLRTVNVETEPAGLVLLVNVNQIDDNGFVTLSVAPSLTAPTGSFTVPDSGGAAITLLAERQLSSGRVRVRDGQTLLLTGIIQETDRTTTTKVPILGDLPLLGAL